MNLTYFLFNKGNFWLLRIKQKRIMAITVYIKNTKNQVH